jgi:hypothetical protein
MGEELTVASRMSATVRARQRLRTRRGIGVVSQGEWVDGSRLSSCHHWWPKSGDDWQWDRLIVHDDTVVRILASRVFVVVPGFWRDGFGLMISVVQATVEGE